MSGVDNGEVELRVLHEGGDRFDIVIEPFHVSVDQPISAGGDGTAPTPTDLFVASLAACGAFYAQRFLRRHGIERDVNVSCTWKMGQRPARVTEVRLRFDDLGVPDDLRERLLRVIERCTVHNSLHEPPQISIELEDSAVGAVV